MIPQAPDMMLWTAGLLAVYTLVIGTVGAALLRSTAWASRAPRLAVVVWQILSLSVLLAVALAGVLMLSPGPGAHTDWDGLVWSIQMLSQGNFADAAPALWCALIVTASTLVLTRVSVVVIRHFLGSRRQRARHLRQLALLGRTDGHFGAVVIEHPTAVAYCMPGPSPTVVLTSAAVELLDGQELYAVLEHEKAHLRGRHDLILAWSGGLSRALRVFPLFRWAHEEQSRLLEMVADDAAARRASPLTVASAMLHMAESSVRLPALGAGGGNAPERMNRMLVPARPLARWQTALVAVTVAAAALLPLGIAVAPALATSDLQACGLAGPSPSA